ncbi:hypothetical protein NCG89_10790 [Spongiibacter taiwanensis]|uniref:hypothetical protein n=1 Tax=Spongiibacter taiwanensis TaxID=1748242 RepID=UPI00203537E7|nr:hypothetical protein [Spongiibacter taiwanensis]USA42008.1 hypothetical protein NCG89_10790 [Spongiibacter taiwanensis]
MKRTSPAIPPRALTILFLLITCLAQSGCVTNARDYAWSNYKEKKAWIWDWRDDWKQTSPSDFQSELAIMLDDSGKGRYSNQRNMPYSYELESSNAPLVVAWMEFKKGTHTVPVYRYVVLPLKGISAETLLEKNTYLTGYNGSLPARLPAKAQAGAVVTDWQFCFECAGVGRSYENLKPSQIAALSKSLAARSKQLFGISFLDKPKKSVTFYSGEEAFAQQAKLTEAINAQAEAMTDARAVDQQYRHLIEQQYQPLTFDSWAKRQGCPTTRAGYNRNQSADYNARRTLQINTPYLQCRTKALESYPAEAYAAQYPELAAREKALWEKSSKQNRTIITKPEDMLANAVRSLEKAAGQIDEAYETLDDLAAQQVRAQQAEAFSRANWAATMASINARNAAIAQQQQQVNQMVSDARARPRPANNTAERHRPEHRPAANRESPSESKQSIPRTSEPDVTAQRAPATSAAPKPAAPAPAATPQPEKTGLATAAQEKQTPPEPNTFVGAARDYRMTGDSGSFYPRATAIDLAQTQLRNQATAFCKDSFKVHITWSAQADCQRSAHSDEVQCTQDALINCYQNRCEQAFCGTRTP